MTASPIHVWEIAGSGAIEPWRVCPQCFNDGLRPLVHTFRYESHKVTLMDWQCPNCRTVTAIRKRHRDPAPEEVRATEDRFALRLKTVKEAVAWYRNERANMADHVRIHWRAILENEDSHRAAFVDPHHPLADESERFHAALNAMGPMHGALKEFLSEHFHIDLDADMVAAHDALVDVLTQFHSHGVNVLLPLARAEERRHVLGPREDESVVDPDDPLASLPSADRAEFHRQLRGVTDLRKLDAVLESEFHSYVDALDGSHSEDERRTLAVKYRANLDKVKRDFALKRGWVA